MDVLPRLIDISWYLIHSLGLLLLQSTTIDYYKQWYNYRAGNVHVDDTDAYKAVVEQAVLIHWQSHHHCCIMTRCWTADEHSRVLMHQPPHPRNHLHHLAVQYNNNKQVCNKLHGDLPRIASQKQVSNFPV